GVDNPALSPPPQASPAAELPVGELLGVPDRRSARRVLQTPANQAQANQAPADQTTAAAISRAAVTRSVSDGRAKPSSSAGGAGASARQCRCSSCRPTPELRARFAVACSLVPS